MTVVPALPALLSVFPALNLPLQLLPELVFVLSETEVRFHDLGWLLMHPDSVHAHFLLHRRNGSVHTESPVFSFLP